MAKYAAQGTVVQYEDPGAAPGTFVTVAQITSISGPTLSAEEIDVTCMDVGGGYRQFLPGFKDGGELSFGLVFDPELSDHKTFFGFFENNTQLTWRVVFNTNNGGAIADRPYMQFSGFVRGFETSAEVGGALTAEATVRLSGAPTLTDPTP